MVAAASLANPFTRGESIITPHIQAGIGLHKYASFGRHIAALQLRVAAGREPLFSWSNLQVRDVSMSVNSRSPLFGLIAASLAGLCASVSLAMAQGAQPSLLGTFDDWEAYKTNDSRGSVCYAISAPKSKEPAAAKRDPIFFMITTWPKANIAHEPSVIIGYQFKDGSKATVQVGSDKFEFFTKGDGAWMPTGPDEGRLVTGLRTAGEMTVKGISKRGTLTTDTYSLKGISAALDKAVEGCK